MSDAHEIYVTKSVGIDQKRPIKIADLVKI